MKTASEAVRCSWSAVRRFGLLGSLAAAAPASASAADTLMPTIVHEACPEYEEGKPFVVRARFEDESQLYDPQVVYRLGTDSDWKQVPLTKAAGSDDFTATIEVGDLARPLEYFIQVFDEHGNGPARFGNTDAPIEVLPAGVPAPCRQIPEQRAVTVTGTSARPEAGGETAGVLDRPMAPPDQQTEGKGPVDAVTRDPSFRHERRRTGRSSAIGPLPVFITGGVAVAAGIATLGLDVGTGRKVDALRHDPGDDEAYVSGKRLQTAERITLGVTAAAAIAAGAMAFFADFGAKSTEESSVEVAPVADTDAAGIVLVGRFW